MPYRKPKLIFVAGTDTDVGKTYVASALIRYLVASGRSVGVYKPVASGCAPPPPGRTQESGTQKSGTRESKDANSLWEAANRPGTLAEVCPQKFIAPLAPPEAAKREDRIVNARLLEDGIKPWLSEVYDVTIIEGAGGLFSPLADGVLNIDLVKRLRPDHVIIVAANRLGTIHQAVATARAARASGVQLSGFVLTQPEKQSDASAKSNGESIARYSEVHVLATLHHGAHWEQADVLEGWMG